MWDDVARLAARQHGAVGRAQLLGEVGATSGQVGGYVRRGRLLRADHGVYVAAGSAATPLREVVVAVLRAGHGARAAGERLLAASGVRDAGTDGPFTVLVPRGRRLPAFDQAWRPDEHPDAGVPAAVAGIPSWGVPRNLLEAAVDVDDDRVAALADGVRRGSRRRMSAARELVADNPDHPGGRRLLLLGCLDVDAAESPRERLLEVLLHDLRPRRQVRMAPGIRVDFLIESMRVVVEYDGSDHESGRARKRDAGRDERLRALGYEVVHVTAADLRDPAGVLVRIHRAAAVVAARRRTGAARRMR